MDLDGRTEAYRRKHTDRCSRRLPVRRYSDRKRGRPTNREYAEKGIRRD